MSRCFPFPPPGYESNHLELFAKEKHKEKKHRKEKRDKEKGEGKERKGKDRSNDKHKEKKDQKEKHKYKKKEKDRDRDRDKGRVTGGRRNDKQREVLNEEKRENSIGMAEDFRFTEELGRRIKDGEKDATDRMLEDTTAHIQKRLDNMALPTIALKRAGNIGITTKMDAGNKMVLGFSSIQNKSLGNQFIPSGELGSAAENQLSPNLIDTDQKKTEVMARLVVADRRTTANEKASKPIFTEQQRNDGLARKLQETDKRVNGNKVKDRDTTNDKRKEHKDKDRTEKRENGKDKDNLKEKEKEKEKMSEKAVYKHKQHNKVPDIGRKDQVDSLNVKALAPQKENGKNDDLQGNSKMRNRFKVNGFLPEADVRPNKLPRTTASSHLPLENGRTLQPCHLSALSYSATKEGVKDAVKAELIQEAEENKINGRTDVWAGLDLRPSPAEEIKKVHSWSKPPHPDCKYLSQLYTVPKMEDWPEYDKQEWLFKNNHLQPKPGPELEAEEMPQVWAQTMQIDPVNVLALPYVIPY